ncbi:aminoglycoside phosphotransferase family protein [Ornithinimicrobium faecis]|uniref:Aminoglycoside phosphotransferase family protein n=1 Tax=Ornithinimicrobium faecis TaxID=2934158 RepID=A0ABY4YSB7_9MICO|nr:aminoglycoside phosphotransferase family protein [Ornithinimicrobium sp. HY1793]USQ79613.1 aminoglycoside phosphotransferase family protein [Ornithinimicrobium sp. HY1793]
MTPSPAAEVDITLEVVRRLLADQHPDLADRPLSPLGEGWDNAMFRLGQHFLVRLPRRAVAADLVAHEHRWLPEIATLVDLPVPVPVRHGQPTAYFPWSWSITRWIEGRPAVDSPVGGRGRWAGRLAQFLAGLHQPAPSDAPISPFRGVPLAVRDEVTRERLARAGHPRTGELLQVWEQALRAPVYAEVPVWVHGDPHPLNMVVRRGNLAAVIDFGDLTAGDPASDLATAWQTFTWEGRAQFVVRYSQLAGPDEALWQRARGWAVLYSANSLALSDDSPEFTAIAEHTIAQVLDAPDARVGRRA